MFVDDALLILIVIEAGNPDEDELYESAIIDTNMVYELKNEQLVPREKLRGTLPKIEMLDKNKVIYYLRNKNSICYTSIYIYICITFLINNSKI